MKKSSFVALILGTISGVFFALECVWRFCRSGACGRRELSVV